MNIWHGISDKRIKTDDFIVVIEISKGSKKKYEFDKETGMIILDRVLHTSTQYPANYGFIPRTVSSDGDPMDVLVLCSESLAPLSLVRCYPVGIVEMLDNGKLDEKIIAIPFEDPHFNIFRDIKKLPKHVSQEIVHFLGIYKALEDSITEVRPMAGHLNAQKAIKRAKAEYVKKFGTQKTGA
jgi:inorganic pyrophosphatase